MKMVIPDLKTLIRKSRSYTFFTLLELLVVVAIVAIIAVIAVPRFIEARCRAAITKFLGDLDALKTDITGGLVTAQKASERLRDLIQKFNDEIKKSGCFNDQDRQAIISRLQQINFELDQKVVSSDEPEKTIWQRMKEKIQEILN
ncbi:MAG: prepilin-type N-terminal cleavage/methylation domain-containing protein [Chitinophagales bacterium]|nr:prepilin-type N-terminal cleavage/methylation domain-containing protein [Chitinophagales bacterium]